MWVNKSILLVVLEIYSKKFTQEIKKIIVLILKGNYKEEYYY